MWMKMKSEDDVNQIRREFDFISWMKWEMEWMEWLCGFPGPYYVSRCLGSTKKEQEKKK